MLVRVKQFFSAISAKLSQEDLAFVNKYLNQAEKRLFFRLDLPTQKHSVKVSKASLALANQYRLNTDQLNLNLLIKASLLHDIGKPAGGIKTWHRVVIVFTCHFFPSLAKVLADQTERSIIKLLVPKLSQAFYLQKNHPVLGGYIANQNQISPKVVKLIKKHHQPLSDSSSLELRLLQEADNLH